MQQVVTPMPRRKSRLWKFAFWLLALIILVQLVWLISIPILRKTVEVEKKHTLPTSEENN